MPAADSLCLELWGLWREYKLKTPRAPVMAAALPAAAHSDAEFAIADLLVGEILTTKTGHH